MKLSLLLLVAAGVDIVESIGLIDRQKYRKCQSKNDLKTSYQPYKLDWRGQPCNFGRFREEKTIYTRATGGQKDSVYIAIDSVTQEKVIVKSVTSHRFTQNEECFYTAVERNPLIPEYCCSFTREDGQKVFLVIKFIEGETLSNLLELGQLSGAELAIKMLLGVGPLIQSFYTQGFLHRDVKPDNVMLTPKGTVVLIDYGFAGFATDVAPSACTPNYAAPELVNYFLEKQQLLFSWDTFRKYDFYSLGASLVLLLTRAIPFSSVNSQLILLTIGKGFELEGLCNEFPDFSPILVGLLQASPEDRKTFAELESETLELEAHLKNAL